MSIHTKEVILIVLNVIIAFSYMALSIVAGRIFVTIGATVSDKYINGSRAITCAIIGSALFLFGCGIHHLHLATHMIPESVNAFGHRSLWIQMFTENVILHGAQAIGAPLLLWSGWYMNRRAKKLAYIQQVAKEHGLVK